MAGNPKAPQASLLYRLFAHVLIFGFCVGLPVGVMLIMPVATTTFTRTGDAISATSVRKVFLVIPFLTQTVAKVTAVDDDYVHGFLSQTTRSGPVNDPKRSVTRTEDMGWLVIQGESTSVKVPVSPESLDEMRREVRDFLADATRPELRLFTVANWKISIITGGVLSLLTVIYVGCVLWSLISKLFGKGGSAH